MNCCGGPVTEQDKTNKQISDQLKKDRKTFDNEIRLLLLGAGESGKSTIAKQMKIIHMNGFSKTECAEYLNAIHTNIWESLQNLSKACSVLEGAAMKNPKNKEFAATFQQPFSGKISLNFKDDIKNVLE